MYRCFAMAGLVAAIWAAPLHAEDAVPIWDETNLNAYFTQFTPIDHPDCAAPGEVAMSVQFAAPARSYVLRDVHGRLRAKVLRAGQAAVEDRICMRTERRGVDAIQIAVPCPNDEMNAALANLETLTIEMRLEAEINSCLSPTGYRMLDSDWTVRLDDGDNAVWYDGVFDQIDADVVPQPALGPWMTAPRATVKHLMLQPFETWGRGKNHPFASQFDGTTVASIKIECAPFTVPRYRPDPLFLEADFYLIFADEPVSSCVGADCPDFGVERHFRRSRLLNSDCAAR